MSELDQRVSRRLQRIMERVQRVVDDEVGERLGIGLVLFPYGETGRVVEYQYASNTNREHMHEALKALVEKWDAGHADVPPHEKQ